MAAAKSTAKPAKSVGKKSVATVGKKTEKGKAVKSAAPAKKPVAKPVASAKKAAGKSEAKGAVKKAVQPKASTKKATPVKPTTKKASAKSASTKKVASTKQAEKATAKKAAPKKDSAIEQKAKKSIKAVVADDDEELEIEEDIELEVDVTEEGVDLADAKALEEELESALKDDLAELDNEETTTPAVSADAIILSDVDEGDEPQQTVMTAGATADPVKDYLKQIGKVPLLNAEEEVELAQYIEAGLWANKLYGENGENLKTAGARTVKCTECKMVAKKYVEFVINYDGDKNRFKICSFCLEEMISFGESKKEHLLNANLRLVVSLAKRYTGRGMLFLDLIQEGNLGLIRAVEKFDYKKGYKFSTYATWWIRQAITRAMADQARTIRIPVHMVEVINKLARVQRQMLQDLGREPTPEELARELDMTPEKVVEVQKYGREPISLHTPLGEEGDSEFGDLIEDSEAIVPADAVAFRLLQDQLEGVLDTLSDRESGVVRMRFGLTDGQPKTLDEIGKVYGVTRERIRQIESKTMSKLRHPSRSQSLRDYLD